MTDTTDITDDKEITDVKPKGQHGGARRNSGGARPGSGRKAGTIYTTSAERRKNRTFTATETEWELIKQNALANNESTGDFIRKCAIACTKLPNNQ